MIRHETLVLIAGSARIHQDGWLYAGRLVQRVKQLGHTVIVGDAPYGVEKAVVQACQRHRVPVIVCGIAPIPRSGGCWHGAYVRVERDVLRGTGGQ